MIIRILFAAVVFWIAEYFIDLIDKYWKGT